MRLFSLLASSVVVSAVSLVSFVSVAQAADPAPPAPKNAGVDDGLAPATGQPPQKDVVKSEDGDDDIKRIALEINPLGVLIGRYSISGEYMLAKHHAVTLSPFFAHVPVSIEANGQEIDGGSLTGFGAEAGYRFYSGSKGANGFYVGPSLLFASYSSSNGSGDSSSFTALGGAIDIGGQAIIGPGVVVGGGFGLQYTSNSEELNSDNLNLASAVIASGGVRPRFLLSAGYAF